MRIRQITNCIEEPLTPGWAVRKFCSGYRKKDRSFRGGQALLNEIRAYLPPEKEHLADDLNYVLVEARTVMGESLPRLRDAQAMMLKWLG